MKVIIHYQEDITKTVNFTVSKLSNLKHLIDIYPDEDIEGEIRPSAKNNPELNDILLAIYDHKMALWKKTGGGFMSPMGNSPPHEKFIQVLVKNGIELKYEFSMNVNKNANKSMWVGTRGEYVALPVKDPNTIYSITA